MKSLLFHFLILLAIVVLIDSTEAPKSRFTLKYIKSHFQQAYKYVKKTHKYEPIIPIPIERNWMPKSKRAKRDVDEDDPPKNASGTPPKRVIVADKTSSTKMGQYIYAVAMLVGSLGLLIFSGVSMMSTGTRVIVRDLEDRSTPPREYPTYLTLDMRAKRVPRPYPMVMIPKNKTEATKLRRWNRRKQGYQQPAATKNTMANKVSKPSTKKSKRSRAQSEK